MKSRIFFKADVRIILLGGLVQGKEHLSQRGSGKTLATLVSA
jgi:hypothetical protein